MFQRERKFREMSASNVFILNAVVEVVLFEKCRIEISVIFPVLPRIFLLITLGMEQFPPNVSGLQFRKQISFRLCTRKNVPHINA